VYLARVMMHVIKIKNMSVFNESIRVMINIKNSKTSVFNKGYDARDKNQKYECV
jgi:hypothetical protein